jgi:hypothetical protein
MPTTVICDGILSVQEALVSGKLFGLKVVTRSTAVPPDDIDLGAKLLFISAGSDI